MFKFADILRYLRLEKGINQIELAKIMNCRQSTVSLWENGLREPSMSSLIALAQFFGVTIDYLVGLEDD